MADTAPRQDGPRLRHQVKQLMTVQEARTDTLQELAQQSRSWIEEVLRNLHNIAYLGQHPASTLQIVSSQIDHEAAETVTPIEQGHAVRGVVEALVARLRPSGAIPTEPYPAEWRLYAIIHGAYILGESSRDIMGKLYISEATYHRSRRQALNILADALIELERAAQQQRADDDTEPVEPDS